MKKSSVSNTQDSDSKLTDETPVKKMARSVSQSRYDTFFKQLKADKPVCLSVNRHYNEHYITSSLQAKYPGVLSELFDESCVGMSREDLLEHCNSLLPLITVSDEEAQNVERDTTEQAYSKLWFRLRTENPSLSLLKQICYPNEYRFTNDYIKDNCKNHINLKTQNCGLFLNPKYPHMGASPDCLVECDCCGKVCLEVKCLHCMRNKNRDERLKLKRNHAYYSQVQTQLFLCDVDYCDFIVWTPKDMFVVRIEPNPEEWKRLLNLLSKFFAAVVLPELRRNNGCL
uniref:YqaJ viral recombinase domain-containing protein n=1 Tax=Hippocampus comes TaxID=109280 RepID=A0A3Q2YV71_HIPCM